MDEFSEQTHELPPDAEQRNEASEPPDVRLEWLEEQVSQATSRIDEAQILAGAEEIRRMESQLTPEAWASLGAEQQVAALQQLEDRLAASQQRPAVEVSISDELPIGVTGQSNNEGITVATATLNDAWESVRTLTHESRHLYQLQVAGMDHPLDPRADRWRSEFDSYISSEENPLAYRQQAVEDDAFEFENRVIEATT